MNRSRRVDMFSSGSLDFQDMFWYLRISGENHQNIDIFEKNIVEIFRTRLKGGIKNNQNQEKLS